jgi:hypothetical protein
MPPVIYPLIVLLLVFVLAKYLMCKENQDRDKVEAAFDTVKNDPKTINYLAFVSDQPLWRLSLVGAMIGGMLFYILSILMTNVSWGDNRVCGSTFLAVFMMYFTTATIGNYISSHNVCPRNCNDRYRFQDKCTKFSLLPCDN